MSVHLLVATTNAGKAREWSKALKGRNVTVDWLGQHRPVRPPVEHGKTFLDNALIKASYYARRLATCAFAEDSGLVVEALAGAPGVRSARLLGTAVTDEERCQHILGRLRRHPLARQRTAWFVAAGALVDPEGRPLFTAVRRCRGRIARAPAGHNGFGYDPIFYFPSAGRTFAEMSAAEKNRVSHRGKLARVLRRFLASHPLHRKARE